MEEAIPCALPPLSVFGEALFADEASRGKDAFRRCQISMSNARLTRSRETRGGGTQEVESWAVESIVWYVGCESRRQPPHALNLTFIERERPVEKTKERPHFGKTLSFPSRELFVKWIAAMMVAEHGGDIRPPETLLNIDED